VDLGTRFRKLRVEAGLTGSALAKPRYTVSYVSQIEAGRRKPSSEALEFFADRLGVSSRYLSTGVPEGLENSLRYRLEEAKRLLRLGRAGEAERILKDLLGEARQFGLTRLEAQVVAGLGASLAGQGRIREAIDAYEEALNGELPAPDVANTVSRLASAYLRAGDLSYAAELIETFLNKSDGQPLDPKVATDLQSILVSIYFERGDVLRAERAARRALASADEQTPPEVRAIAYWNASRVLAEGKMWDEALDLASRARILMEELQDRRNVARLHNAYAFICLDAEPPRAQEARGHLDKAEELLEQAAGSGDMAYLFTERARLALIEDRAEDALHDAERALADAGPDELEIARGLFMKGRALASLGDRPEATRALQESAALFGGRGARQQEAGCWREIGELDLAAGDLESAVQALRAGLGALDPRRTRA
jgi:tetratricopeptide (TPR) repeat protein